MKRNTVFLCYSDNFSLKQLRIAVITNVLEYKAGLNLKFKCVCILMCYLRSVQINIVIIIVFISTVYKQAASLYIMYFKLYSV